MAAAVSEQQPTLWGDDAPTAARPRVVSKAGCCMHGTPILKRCEECDRWEALMREQFHAAIARGEYDAQGYQLHPKTGRRLK